MTCTRPSFPGIPVAHVTSLFRSLCIVTPNGARFPWPFNVAGVYGEREVEAMGGRVGALRARCRPSMSSLGRTGVGDRAVQTAESG